MPVPLPKQVFGPTVHHYTNGAGLLGILDSRSLWASSPLALNDTSEFSYGLSVVRAVWREWQTVHSLPNWQANVVARTLDEDHLGTARDRAYFVSASRNGDSLNQWQGYAGRLGYAVGIKTDEYLALLTPGDSAADAAWRRLPLAGELWPGWYDVIYDPDKQKAEVVSLLEFLLAGLPVDPSDAVAIGAFEQHARYFLGTLVSLLKDESFSREEEVRYIVSTPLDFPEYFRERRFGLVPYQKLVVPAATDPTVFADEPAGGLPISSLRCGPVNEFEQPSVVAAAQRLMNARGYKDVAVTASTVPYRS